MFEFFLNQVDGSPTRPPRRQWSDTVSSDYVILVEAGEPRRKVFGNPAMRFVFFFLYMSRM